MIEFNAMVLLKKLALGFLIISIAKLGRSGQATVARSGGIVWRLGMRAHTAGIIARDFCCA